MIQFTARSRTKTTFVADSDAAMEYLLPYSLGASGVVVWSGLGEEEALDHDPQVRKTVGFSP